jgi:hypothetical protein
MWRSIFIAIGIMAIIVGLECLLIDSANFYAAGQTRASSFFNPAGTPSLNTRAWQPKEWFPWCVLSIGTITILYAFTLPRRFQGPVAG